MDLMMAQTDFSLSLELLTGIDVGDPEDLENAPTPLVRDILRSWKKPLCQLTDWEIGRLVAQHDGYPYVLDLVWPKLRVDPLFEGAYYPGDVLSLLIQADLEIWADRPGYKAELGILYHRALKRPAEENDTFRKTLNLPDSDATVN
ncbi:MAG: hypothetical protein IPL18_03850 [Sphingomonadales bacterium]|nr:hypothetical protein [Sphingomonadales bacterium]